MPRDNNFGPERPERPKKPNLPKPTIVVPKIPDSEIKVQGVTFTLSQCAGYTGGDIEFHHFTSIGQFTDTGKVRILKTNEHMYVPKSHISSVKDILLLKVVGIAGNQRVIPLIQQTKVMHALPIPPNGEKELLENICSQGTFIHSLDYPIFDEYGEINFVIMEVINDVNDWLSGNYFTCSTKHSLWGAEMASYVSESYTGHLAILNGMMNEMRNIQPKDMKEAIEECLDNCNKMGITDKDTIEMYKSICKASVKLHNEKYERFKGWS